jgi:ribosomal protein S6--L-glutamate ligase
MTSGSPRIAFLMEASETGSDVPRVSPLMEDVITRLRARGARIEILLPENQPLDIAGIRPAHDLYVLKEKSPLILSLAAALTLAGAAVVNTVRACSLTRDKVAATAVLAGAGIPVPPSWTTGQPAQFRSLVAEGPLWLKAPRGSRGSGVSRVTDPAALDGQAPAADLYGLPLPLFAQREVPSEGRDLKVFVVGKETWGIARKFPARTLEEKVGTPVTVRPDVQEAALASGRALGLELYGVDFLEADGRFFAVDVNALPGYKGAPEAGRAMADYLYGRARSTGSGAG